MLIKQIMAVSCILHAVCFYCLLISYLDMQTVSGRTANLPFIDSSHWMQQILVIAA